MRIKLAKMFISNRVSIMEKLKEWLNGERGRLKRMATELDTGSNNISQWTRVPAERMGDVERITGIPMEELRPDIFKAAGRLK